MTSIVIVLDMGALLSVLAGPVSNEPQPHCSHHTHMVESLITAATELAIEESKNTRQKRERRKRRHREREMEERFGGG